MHDAQLDFSLGVDGFDRFRKASKTIDAGNQDIFDTPILQMGQHVQPVLGAFIVGQVNTQQLLFAFQNDAQNRVDGFHGKANIVFDLVVNGVQPDNRIDRFQIAFLPGFEFRDQFVGDGVDGAVGHVDAIHLLHVVADGLIAHALREHGQHFTLQFVGQMRLILFDQLRFKSASAITRRIELKVA